MGKVTSQGAARWFWFPFKMQFLSFPPPFSPENYYYFFRVIGGCKKKAGTVSSVVIFDQCFDIRYRFNLKIK